VAVGASYQKALRSLYEGTPLLAELEDWQRFIDELESAFKEAVNDWRRDYETLLGAWRGINENGAGKRRASPVAQAKLNQPAPSWRKRRLLRAQRDDRVHTCCAPSRQVARQQG